MTSDNENSNGNGTKAIDLRDVERRSVIEQNDAPNSRNPYSTQDHSSQVFWFLTHTANEIASWGLQHRLRDKQLRNFITEENIFASALGIICSRNAGFSWRLDGPPRTAARYQEIFETANFGKGWQDLIIKTSIDLYTQDNGAFWEIVRTGKSESSPVIGINHLDSARCTHTGFWETPVIYEDKFGKPHLLRWYEVIELAEMPHPAEAFNGLQFCALTRLLRKFQITRNIDIYDYERTSGRNTRQIQLVKGITSQQLTDAMNEQRSMADAAGLSRYSNPVVVGTLDPKADVGHDTINLVEMPDKYDAEVAFKHYINLIAMAFESDYQEFAPLPGGGLGTGNQSEILHLKNRGKGPGLFMKLITHAINFRVLSAGANVRWLFDEQDLEAEKSIAEVKAIRAQTRATRIQSFEITPEVARQIANDEGDLPEEFIAMMGEENLTENVMVNDSTQADAQSQDLGKPVVVKRPDPNLSTSKTPNPTASRPLQPQKSP